MINQNILSLLSLGKRWDTGREGIIVGENSKKKIKKKSLQSNSEEEWLDYLFSWGNPDTEL